MKYSIIQENILNEHYKYQSQFWLLRLLLFMMTIKMMLEKKKSYVVIALQQNILLEDGIGSTMNLLCISCQFVFPANQITRFATQITCHDFDALNGITSAITCLIKMDHPFALLGKGRSKSPTITMFLKQANKTKTQIFNIMYLLCHQHWYGSRWQQQYGTIQVVVSITVWQYPLVVALPPVVVVPPPPSC